ncbi:MAG: hypothetical protein Q9169_001355 [Polycauliona sp. 2 TL-2023]
MGLFSGVVFVEYGLVPYFNTLPASSTSPTFHSTGSGSSPVNESLDWLNDSVFTSMAWSPASPANSTVKSTPDLLYEPAPTQKATTSTSKAQPPMIPLEYQSCFKFLKWAFSVWIKFVFEVAAVFLVRITEFLDWQPPFDHRQQAVLDDLPTDLDDEPPTPALEEAPHPSKETDDDSASNTINFGRSIVTSDSFCWPRSAYTGITGIQREYSDVEPKCCNFQTTEANGGFGSIDIDTGGIQGCFPNAWQARNVR